MGEFGWTKLAISLIFTKLTSTFISSPEPTGNAMRKAEAVLRWNVIRRELTDCHSQSFAPLFAYCAMCKAPEDRLILCPDCGTTAYYCTACFRRHKALAPLHIGIKWQVRYYFSFVLPTLFFLSCFVSVNNKSVYNLTATICLPGAIVSSKGHIIPNNTHLLILFNIKYFNRAPFITLLLTRRRLSHFYICLCTCL